MKHKCVKCGMIVERTWMKRVQKKKGLPSWQCKDCDNANIRRWTEYVKPGKWRF